MRSPTGGIAHDFNNVLTTVMGFAGLLAERVAGDPEAASCVREILVAAERGAALTQLLAAASGRQVPIVREVPASAVASEVPEGEPRVSRPDQTVLVVDDVDAVRAFAAGTLRRAGYRVLVANSASDALYMAGNSRGPIHLLLTDVVMPGSSGLDLARELRAERRGLRVLYMSGYSDNAVAREARLGSEEGFVGKPFTGAGLLAQVAALLH